eukprot:364350-Chlamydomonas_euryale.AAC.3
MYARRSASRSSASTYMRGRPCRPAAQHSAYPASSTSMRSRTVRPDICRCVRLARGSAVAPLAP